MCVLTSYSNVCALLCAYQTRNGLQSVSNLSYFNSPTCYNAVLSLKSIVFFLLLLSSYVVGVQILAFSLFQVLHELVCACMCPFARVFIRAGV